MTTAYDLCCGDYRRFVEIMAKKHFVGMPGFESPGGGQGAAQQVFTDDMPTVLWFRSSGSYYPAIVTYKWLQQFVGDDGAEIDVQTFFEEVFVPIQKEAGLDDGIFAWTKRFMAWVNTFESDAEFERLVSLLRTNRDEAICAFRKYETGEWEPDGWVSDYMYNYDTYFTQDFEWIASARWRHGKSDWIAIILHTGMDPRCGFTGPVFLRIPVTQFFQWAAAKPDGVELFYTFKVSKETVESLGDDYAYGKDDGVILVPVSDKSTLGRLLPASEAKVFGRTWGPYVERVAFFELKGGPK